jgi:ribonuclease HI
MVGDGQVEIWTDGACSGNPGPGGWAALLRWRDHERILTGHEVLTTNNRMELAAVIAGLSALKGSVPVVLYTDSRYVRDGVTRWLGDWKRRGWRTASGSAVRNRDLWEHLEGLLGNRPIDWQWVRGHDGIGYNERVDRLARSAIAGSGSPPARS